jgi:hypothetical protein
MRTSNVERRTSNVEVKRTPLSLLRSSTFKVRRSTFVLIFLITLPRLAHADLKQYDSRYYTIYTDLSSDEEKEAAVRMTRMAEEYHQRTKSFSGAIREKLPFYLFRSREDYIAAGGLPGSDGVFIAMGSGGKLMAIAGRRLSRNTWHVVQHEGFHQFAHMTISGKLPIWLDEGLAEYFGESIFTGDGFVTGVVPPWREQRLKDEIGAGELKSFEKIMAISPQAWAAEMDIHNYDQAWSMVHFLVHGDDEKYQSAFGQCIASLSRGRDFNRAWLDTLGSADGFETRWKDWWTKQPESPTRPLYLRAAVATVTSYVARAYVAKQTFGSFDDFKSAVDSNGLKSLPEDWLPPELIQDTVRLYGELPNWEITTGSNKQPMVALSVADGMRATGSFTLSGQMVNRVDVDLDDLAKVLKDAQAMLDVGQKQDAKQRVLESLKNHPKSPAAADARKWLQSIK